MRRVFLVAALLNAYLLSGQVVKYKSSQKLNSTFFKEYSKLEKIFSEKVDFQSNIGSVDVEIFKEKRDEDAEWEPDVEYKAAIRIGGNFYPFKLGDEPNVSFYDAKGKNGAEKIIVVYSGCFSSAGCLAETYLIRVFKNQSFTFTDFDGDFVSPSSANFNDELYREMSAFSKSEYYRLIKKGTTIISYYFWDELRPYVLEVAYELYGRGFRKILSKKKFTKSEY